MPPKSKTTTSSTKPKSDAKKITTKTSTKQPIRATKNKTSTLENSSSCGAKSNYSYSDDVMEVIKTQGTVEVAKKINKKKKRGTLHPLFQQVVVRYANKKEILIIMSAYDKPEMQSTSHKDNHPAWTKDTNYNSKQQVGQAAQFAKKYHNISFLSVDEK